MSLIDADNLFLPLAQEVNRLAERIEKTIDRQERVEAIPVEWLLEWEQKYNESLPLFFRGETVIKEVIRDWRAENGTD